MASIQRPPVSRSNVLSCPSSWLRSKSTRCSTRYPGLLERSSPPRSVMGRQFIFPAEQDEGAHPPDRSADWAGFFHKNQLEEGNVVPLAKVSSPAHATHHTSHRWLGPSGVVRLDVGLFRRLGQRRSATVR